MRLRSIFWTLAKLYTLLALAMLLAGCGPTMPSNTSNICSIFNEYPSWYQATQNTYRKWGIPINVQMAILKQESHFVANARPPRRRLLGFIPWKHQSTAYGYAQALDGTWKDYQQATGNYNGSRTNFADADDFLGWYSNAASRAAGISKTDAYALYLAYHEGIRGYQNGSYRKKAWLMGVARRVSQQANVYQNQLRYCQADLASNARLSEQESWFSGIMKFWPF